MKPKFSSSPKVCPKSREVQQDSVEESVVLNDLWDSIGAGTMSEKHIRKSFSLKSSLVRNLHLEFVPPLDNVSGTQHDEIG